jgi:hypothetical protein
MHRRSNVGESLGHDTSLGAAYRRFWQNVGEKFPDLGGAASTAYYLENEKRLLTEHLPDLARSAILKTDLWDEVKNTRILQWTRAQGATAFGVDISEPIILEGIAINSGVSNVEIYFCWIQNKLIISPRIF